MTSQRNDSLQLLVCQAQANGNNMYDVTVIQRLAVNLLWSTMTFNTESKTQARNIMCIYILKENPALKWKKKE